MSGCLNRELGALKGIKKLNVDFQKKVQGSNVQGFSIECLSASGGFDVGRSMFTFYNR
jgi:hypothetical protein